ncbi:MAG: hypothetical protein JWM34_2552 [Ilumatobacteraceae bacterium]|nr:hypothetical protein [Ilumatobacteraceae bacterium]
MPITPCRLFDTRAGSTVGARNTPLGTGETLTAQVTGTNGNCTIPAGASGVAMNVTTVNGTAASFLTAWPADATQPTASNLNWVAGSPPTPNKVDVKLSAAGKVSFFNNAGTVDVIADVVGFYDAIDLGAGGTTAPAITRVALDPGSFSSDGMGTLVHDFTAGSMSGSSNVDVECAISGIQLPNGATVTGLVSHVSDNSANAGADVRVQLFRNTFGVSNAELMATETTTGAPGPITLTTSTVTEPVIDNTQFTYSVTVCGLVAVNRFFDTFVNLS